MELYREYILKNAPKVLTQIDRDAHSKTYGSCDRNHWHLKIRDFTSAILQQSGLFLAVLYDLEFEGNIFYHNKNVRDWAEATVRYWAEIQLKDGSFNEYYPWEHGFPPTAFSLFSSCEIYRRLQLHDTYLERKIEKTARHLTNHIEKQALNQELASITALYDAWLILKKDWIKEGLEKKLSLVLKRRSKEGWFPEYEGADLGYLSVSLDMLAEYYYLSRDKRVLGPLNDMVAFIQYFVHPDQTVGGEYGARNTTYFLPCGLQTMANEGNKTAETILQHLYGNTEKEFYFLDAVDDRYFSHYLMHSFARALERRRDMDVVMASESLPFELVQETYFSEAGLCSKTAPDYFAVLGLKKGGVIKVYKNGREIWMDCGYRINYGNGTVSAMNWQDNTYKVSKELNGYSVDGSFNKVHLKVSTPILHIGLRAIALLAGNRIIGFLKRQIILVKKHDEIHFKRKIEFLEDRICLTDTISSDKEFLLERASNMSLRHVASGKFFSSSDLIANKGTLGPKAKKIRVSIIYMIGEEKEILSYEKLQ